MKTKMLLVALFISVSSFSQIITSTPAFPSQTEEVTIFYDSNLGNGEVSAVSPIYMHTGVITSNSNGPTDWQNVVGDWGTADAQTLMTDEGNGIHSYTFSPSLEDYYSTDNGETIERLAFVFRNASGSLVGRADDGSDIFYDLSDGSFAINILQPSASSILAELDETITVSAACSAEANLEILIDGVPEESLTESSTISTEISFSLPGEYTVTASAELDGSTVTDEFSVVIIPSPNVADLPEGTKNGINYMEDGTVILRLHAPYKNDVFVLGDFNNWTHSLDYYMNRTPDTSTWWISLEGLDPDTEYRFQYSIDSDIMRVADVYTEKVLDSWNDPFIPSETIANVTPYPTEFTSEPVSVLQINQPEFNWSDDNFEKPEKERLNIYELLVRDFTEEKNYQTIIDTLDYLERLGINAIQFMPVNEFEGNLSWGYNPSFFFAADKFYGGEAELKNFINECHSRGMAVILDMALNHSFGQNPQVRMYFDSDAGQWGQPSPLNPWFNETPMHDFNVGFDYDHSSSATRVFCERVLQYWVEEYHVDGYRMDLSKGFTQTNSLGNIGLWGSYDQSRIDILTNYRDKVNEIDPEAYFILEHFANNDEETALANDGMMLWGNINHEYNEATMGYNSNLSWGSYQERGWNDPHLISYMESHDEERLMYKNLLFGNGSNGYDITNIETALDRVELASSFFYPIPGPKMAWQFGELGYDYSINYCTNGTISEDCRTGEKPVRWDYLEDENRADLYEVVSLLNYLRNNYEFMHTEDFNLDVAGFGKRIHLNGDINATIIGNFSVEPINMVPGFQSTGEWFEVFTGDIITEDNLNNSFLLQPGEYRFYVDEVLDLPSSIDRPETADKAALVYPNPTSGNLNITLDAYKNQEVNLEIENLIGQSIFSDSFNSTSNTVINLAHILPSKGVYLLKLEVNGTVELQKIIFE